MPGFVFFAAIVIILLAGLCFMLVAVPLLRRFAGFGFGQAVLASGAFSAVAGFGFLVASFAPTERDIPGTEALKRFPELARFGVSFGGARYFQDGLSDGEYYWFQLLADKVKALESFLSKDRKRIGVDPLSSGSYHLKRPTWYAAETCSSAIHFENVAGRGADSPYIERFEIHVCRDANKVFLDWVRI